jgi:carboxyl-terminal processing protease
MRELRAYLAIVATSLGLVLPRVGGAQQLEHRASFDSAWSSISRTYYDTVLIQGRWRTAHDSLRAKLGSAPTLDETRAAIRALIAVPGQSHFALIPADAFPETKSRSTDGSTRGTTGITPRLAADTLIAWRVAAGSAAFNAGVRPGDIITHVDSMAVDSVRQRLLRAFPSSPREANALYLQVMTSQLDGSLGDTITVATRQLNGRAGGGVLVLGPLEGRVSRFGNLPPIVIRVSLDSTPVSTPRGTAQIPIIAFSNWFPVIIQDLDRYAFAARRAPGVIVDLRGNSGGAIGIIGGFAGHFSDSVWSLGSMRGRGSTLQLNANPRRVNAANERVGVINTPVAILVDGMSASASEFFASGMQALGRAKVFGEVTAGQSLPAAMLRLPSGDVLMHPIADHEDARGRRVEGIGVQPDTRTPLVRSELAAGRDAALEAAKAWLADTLARP